MITFIKALNSSVPPVPGIPGGPRPPGLPIDNGIIIMFFIALALGTYMYYNKIKQKEKVICKKY